VKARLSDSTLQAFDGAACVAATLLAFPLAGCALLLERSSIAALILLSAGFALLLTARQRANAEGDARLRLSEQLELARLLLGRGAHGKACSIAREVAERARSPRTQLAAVETLAWCELGLGRPLSARNALSWIRPLEALDAYCCAAVEDACGNSLWALRILEEAGRRASLSPNAQRFWIDLCARVRGVEAACQLTLRQLAELDRGDALRVLEFARLEPCAAAPSAQLLAEALQAQRRG
jgi:hypothetical protein